MKPIRFILFLFILSFGTVQFYGQSLKDTAVVDFKAVDIAIQEKFLQYGPENVLVVLDIDNTLLTSDTDLGSDTWYQWQNGELGIKPAPEQKLSERCLYGEAIGLLFELGTMSLTDSLLPGYIKSWQNAGGTVFTLTSRSPDYRAATERELERNHIHLSASGITTIDGNDLSFRYNLKREISYMDGIMMTTGQDKGEMLDHILGRSGRTFKAIIFADDTPKNIQAVKSHYSEFDNAELILFNYTRILTERKMHNNGQELTREQADKMARDWEMLMQTLITLFPDRLEKSDCARPLMPIGF
jgi:hypothetical protein